MTEVIGVDLGGTKVAVACLRGRELERVAARADRSGAGPSADRAARGDDRLLPGRRARGASGSAFRRSSSSRPAGWSRRSTSRWPTSRCARCWASGSGVPVFVDNDATVAALAEAHDDAAADGRPEPGDDHDRHRGRGRPRAGRPDLSRRDRRRRRARPHADRRADLVKASPGAGRAFRSPARSSMRPPATRSIALAVSAPPSEHPDSALGQLLAEGKHVIGVEAVEAAHARRRGGGRGSVRFGHERLGIGIANAINTFDPEEVVIGGGGARAGELLLEPARRVAPATSCPASAGGRRSASPATACAPACSARRCSPRMSWTTSAAGRPPRRPVWGRRLAFAVGRPSQVRLRR